MACRVPQGKKMWTGLAVLLSLTGAATAQPAGALTGTVRDGTTGEPLPGATVALVGTDRGTATNRSGYFVLREVSVGAVRLHVSFVGYRDTTLAVVVAVGERQRVEIGLRPATEALAEVVVEEESARYGSAALVGVIVMPVERLAEIPTPGGEHDLFRALQMLPGIASGNEVSSGLYVRGGTSDQNLILLDGVPVYNPWHLFGFFSTFNADALKDVRLIKGIPPAEYGGRLSSVLDLSMNEGRQDRFGGAAHLGLVSSRLVLEGPLARNLTFMTSLRRTYFDLATSLVDRAMGGALYDDLFPRYAFDDLNGKLVWQVSPRSKLALSGYYGSDRFRLDQRGRVLVVHPLTGGESYSPSRGGIRYGWRNTTLGLRFEHAFGTAAYLTAQTYLTRYDFGSDFFLEADSVLQPSGELAGGVVPGPAAARLLYDVDLTDLAARADLDVYTLAPHRLRAGFQVIQHRFDDVARAEADPFYDYLVEPDALVRRTRPMEAALYVQDDWPVTRRLRVQVGLRGTYFSSVNAFRLSPRLAAAYDLSERWRISGGVGHTAQFIQRVTDTLIPIQNDRWVPAGGEIGPADAYQATAEVHFRPIPAYRFTAGAYYRLLDGVYTISPIARGETQPGDDDLALLRPQTRLPVRGDGTAYGLELLVERTIGWLTGYVAYTLARTRRSFRLINRGRPYPAQHDRLHDLTAVARLRLFGSWHLGAAFTFKTGQPLALPAGAYVTDDPFLEEAGGLAYDVPDYNGSRAAPYHRLDLSLKGDLFRIRGNPLVLTLDVYNVYARRNPLVTYWDVLADEAPSGGVESRLQVVQYGGLPVLPSLSLGYTF